MKHLPLSAAAALLLLVPPAGAGPVSVEVGQTPTGTTGTGAAGGSLTTIGGTIHGTASGRAWR
ncbi:MAG: EamA family transporter, partial [Elusimicrobiota bacterium]